MAIPAAALATIAQGAGTLASGGQGTSQKNYAGGIGNKILGAPGDPAGFALDLMMDVQGRREEKRRFDEQMNLQRQRQAIEEMLMKQNIIAAQNQNKWNADFRRGMARG